MKTPSPPRSATPPQPLRDGRIDWAKGRIIGISVADRASEAFDVVQLYLDGQCVVSSVANRSVFELARDMVGIELPAREHSAFEIRIPAGALHAGMTGDSVVHAEIKTAQGELIFDQYLAGLRDLLRLTDVPPTDLLYDVRFRALADGALHGTVIDRHRTGLKPNLQVALNDFPPEPLPLYMSSADGTVHHFSVPVRADRLGDGANSYRVAALDGQPLAVYPIAMGAHVDGATDRRVAALEAELAFLKKLVLAQNLDGLPARLSLLKSEVIGICSEMMTLQRVNFEREVFGVRSDASHVHRLPGAVSAPALTDEAAETTTPGTAATPVRKARAG